MDKQSRSEMYPLSELPNGVSVSSSVLEVERTRADDKLKELFGERLTELMVGDKSKLPEYGAQVTIEDETSWVYIEETWNQNGYEIHRSANTGLNSNESHLSIYIKTPDELAGKEENHTSIEVFFKEPGIISSFRVNSLQNQGYKGDTLPYINDLLNMRSITLLKDGIEEKFDKRGQIYNLLVDIKINEDILDVDAKASSIFRAGNGFNMQRIKQRGDILEYGSKLTNIPLITSVETHPINLK